MMIITLFNLDDVSNTPGVKDSIQGSIQGYIRICNQNTLSLRFLRPICTRR